jgi:hypothetical protein
MALPFEPAMKIACKFELLKKNWMLRFPDEKLNIFINYFESTYIKNGDKKALFDPINWSVFEKIKITSP